MVFDPSLRNPSLRNPCRHRVKAGSWSGSRALYRSYRINSTINVLSFHSHSIRPPEDSYQLVPDSVTKSALDPVSNNSHVTTFQSTRGAASVAPANPSGSHHQSSGLAQHL